MIALGDKSIKNINLGDETVNKISLGDILVWQKQLTGMLPVLTPKYYNAPSNPNGFPGGQVPNASEGDVFLVIDVIEGVKEVPKSSFVAQPYLVLAKSDDGKNVTGLANWDNLYDDRETVAWVSPYYYKEILSKNSYSASRDFKVDFITKSQYFQSTRLNNADFRVHAMPKAYTWNITTGSTFLDTPHNGTDEGSTFVILDFDYLDYDKFTFKLNDMFDYLALKNVTKNKIVKFASEATFKNFVTANHSKGDIWVMYNEGTYNKGSMFFSSGYIDIVAK